MQRTAYGKAFYQQGFSLYESIVTVVIAGLVGTLAIPNIKPALANQRMIASVNTLVTALQLTRSEAIHNGQRAVLCPTQNGETCLDSYAEWHRGYMLFIDRNASRDRDADEPIVRIFDAHPQVQLRSSRGRDHITYQANGLASGSNATFVFCDTGKSARPRKVFVSNSGRPRVLPAEDSSLCG